MGCVSSTLLSNDEELAKIGGSTNFGHHIVSLTSTTYGLLTLDPPATPPSSPPPTSVVHPSPTTAPTPPRITLRSLFPPPATTRTEMPEVINSWELMAGLDSTPTPNKENSDPNLEYFKGVSYPVLLKKDVSNIKYALDGFEEICPPNGEHRVVMYSTTLRGVRKTFEDCNVVRSAIEGFGVSICERDMSMDRGFRDELKELLKGKEGVELIPPRVFVKGRYIGGVEEVVRMFEDGELGELLQGLPRLKAGFVCEGCGGARFLPCFSCNGSCKMVVVEDEDDDDGSDLDRGRSVVVRCSNCNENGLVQCPICC